jgi:hypothetical protein
MPSPQTAIQIAKARVCVDPGHGGECGSCSVISADYDVLWGGFQQCAFTQCSPHGWSARCHIQWHVRYFRALALSRRPSCTSTVHNDRPEQWHRWLVLQSAVDYVVGTRERLLNFLRTDRCQCWRDRLRCDALRSLLVIILYDGAKVGRSQACRCLTSPHAWMFMRVWHAAQGSGGGGNAVQVGGASRLPHRRPPPRRSFPVSTRSIPMQAHVKWTIRLSSLVFVLWMI